MPQLVTIQITGLGIRPKYSGENPELDFFDAVRQAAETLQKENLYMATVCLFEDENDEHEKAVKKIELMRHK